MALPEALPIQFVEIAPDVVDTAPNPEPAAKPEPEPSPQEEPAPVPPEPVVQPPDPHDITREPPKPKLKPKPRPKPRPELKAVRPAPQIKPVEAPSVAPTGTATAVATPKAPAPDRNVPHLIGHVNYLGQRPMPEYPRQAQRRGEKGRVVVRVLISPQGTVASVKLRVSSGYGMLDESALRAARLARFKPYTVNGVAYPALADIPFDFVL
ncbi:MAG: energy transducer TonB [Burkholderiaceae bacterium]|nr:MAG: energy transducer TonB [Burkholderiaceae bacterium]TAM02766.1 MAG: energy transducer TonB [Pusillimonas sp.]